jgi:hypothetical protein
MRVADVRCPFHHPAPARRNRLPLRFFCDSPRETWLPRQSRYRPLLTVELGFTFSSQPTGFALRIKSVHGRGAAPGLPARRSPKLRRGAADPWRRPRRRCRGSRPSHQSPANARITRAIGPLLRTARASACACRQLMDAACASGCDHVRRGRTLCAAPAWHSRGRVDGSSAGSCLPG